MGCQLISLKALAINIKHANAILSAILCKDSIKHPLHSIQLYCSYCCCILVGIVAAEIYNVSSHIELTQALSFFNGRRLAASSDGREGWSSGDVW